MADKCNYSNAGCLKKKFDIIWDWRAGRTKILLHPNVNFYFVGGGM